MSRLEVTKFMNVERSTDVIRLIKILYLPDKVQPHKELVLVQESGVKVGPFTKCEYHVAEDTWKATIHVSRASSSEQLVQWIEKAEEEGWEVVTNQ